MQLRSISPTSVHSVLGLRIVCFGDQYEERPTLLLTVTDSAMGHMSHLESTTPRRATSNAGPCHIPREAFLSSRKDPADKIEKVAHLPEGQNRRDRVVGPGPGPGHPSPFTNKSTVQTPARWKTLSRHTTRKTWTRIWNGSQFELRLTLLPSLQGDNLKQPKNRAQGHPPLDRSSSILLTGRKVLASSRTP